MDEHLKAALLASYAESALIRMVMKKFSRRTFYEAAIAMIAISYLLAATQLCMAQAGRWGQGPPPAAGPVNTNPEILNKVSFEQRLNEQLPLDLVFRDEEGRSVELGQYFHKKPVVLALVYYTCPMLCNQILSGLTKAISGITSMSVGREYEIVTVSFDPRETPQDAREKKPTYINWYRRDGASEGWHFLTGDQESINRIAQAVGFNYTWDEKTNQFAHASGIMVLTPEGKLSRYFYGIEYAPRDLQLGLVEASDNKIGSLVDQLLLYCFHYDPATGKYGLVVMNLVRIGGVLTLVGVVAFVFVMKRRARRRDSANREGVF